jgi:hypothetical protein
MTEQDSQPVQTSPHLLRPTRIALGWLNDEMGGSFLNHRTNQPPTPEQTERIAAARAAVASRDPGLDQEGAVQLNPPILSPHRERFAATAYGAALLSDGWEIALADLTRLRAYQPNVYVDREHARLGGLDLEDVQALAEFCIPTTTAATPAPQFDPSRNAFLIASSNLNLQIMGNGVAQTPEGMPLLGFLISLRPSVVNVANYQDKLVLHDGYHRSVALVAAGATVVPTLVRRFSSLAEMAPNSAGFLPEQSYLGERPPTIADYLDDEVSALVEIPSNQKLIVIQGLELSPFA